jgi:hypothetical protein
MSPAKTKTAIDSLGEIATLRIELKDTNPLIWCQVEAPTSITLKVLHDIVQQTVGWFDYHLWAFTIGEQRYGSITMILDASTKSRSNKPSSAWPNDATPPKPVSTRRFDRAVLTGWIR